MNINMTYLSRSFLGAQAAMQSIVREHGSDGAAFKIGMSVRPVQRVFGVTPSFLEPGGRPKKVGRMNRNYRWVRTLYLLFETTSREECQHAERQLITELETLVSLFSPSEDAFRNRTGGGGGRRPVGHVTYYVYLARS